MLIIIYQSLTFFIPDEKKKIPPPSRYLFVHLSQGWGERQGDDWCEDVVAFAA
jgi:hypothetical protein